MRTKIGPSGSADICKARVEDGMVIMYVGRMDHSAKVVMTYAAAQRMVGELERACESFQEVKRGGRPPTKKKG